MAGVESGNRVANEESDVVACERYGRPMLHLILGYCTWTERLKGVTGTINPYRKKSVKMVRQTVKVVKVMKGVDERKARSTGCFA